MPGHTKPVLQARRKTDLVPREERSDNFFKELRARWMVPMHWGAFDLTDEPVDAPPRELRRAVGESDGNMGQIRLMAVGERWRLG